MDQERFDHLARGLASGISRRGMVRTLTGAALGGVLVTVGASAAGARKKKRGQRGAVRSQAKPGGGGGGKCPRPNRCGKGRNAQCCTSSQLCDNGSCEACGGNEEQCCANDTCSGELQCTDIFGGRYCVPPPCGEVNDPCCAGGTCATSLICKDTVCVQCVGQAGEPCCTGLTPCKSGLGCHSGACESDSRTVSLTFAQIPPGLSSHCHATVHVAGFAAGSYVANATHNGEATIAVDGSGDGAQILTYQGFNIAYEAGRDIEALVDGVASGKVTVSCP